jgi:hypothetical protein
MRPSILAVTLLVGTVTTARADVPEAPVLLDAVPPGKAVVRLPNGTIKILFFVAGEHCASIRSDDDGSTWGQPRVEFPFDEPRAGVPLAFVDRDGRLHAFLLVRRGTGSRPTVDYFYDIWHNRTTPDRRQWEQPKHIFEGYVGALNGVAQLAGGRIVLAQQFWVPGRTSAPPTGSHVVTANYSDDGGATWQLAPGRLTAPCYPDYIGSNYGACEPVVLALKDSRAWMLLRTQTGFLYQSFSPDGVDWSPAAPTAFRSSNSPANVVRLPDGRIVLFWNNCENPSRVDGAPVYTTRDALHAAVSRDDGKTWRGFREVHRDPYRNEPPPKRGDRGTAYPFSTVTGDGKVLLATGQGRGRTALLRIDPDWLEATHHEDDFSGGLDGWSVFKPFGPASGYWRNRTQGPQLVDPPDKGGANSPLKKGTVPLGGGRNIGENRRSQRDSPLFQRAAKVLHIRRPDDKAGDEAVWNFPAGRRGRLVVRLMLQAGFAGARIALADRFIPPGDPVAEELAVFRLTIDSDGRLEGGPQLAPGRWYTLAFDWDLGDGRCGVLLDGAPSTALARVNRQSDAVSYLRLASTAEELDRAGCFVERVSVDVHP